MVYDRVLACAVCDPTFAQVIRGHFDLNAVASQNTNIVFAHFARDMSNHFVVVFETNAKHGIWQRLGDDAFELDEFFFVGHSLPSELGKAHII